MITCEDAAGGDREVPTQARIRAILRHHRVDLSDEQWALPINMLSVHKTVTGQVFAGRQPPLPTPATLSWTIDLGHSQTGLDEQQAMAIKRTLEAEQIPCWHRNLATHWQALQTPSASQAQYAEIVQAFGAPVRERGAL